MDVLPYPSLKNSRNQPNLTCQLIKFIYSEKTTEFDYFNMASEYCRRDLVNSFKLIILLDHGLRTPREEIDFTSRPKIHYHSQIIRYSRSIFCLPHRPKFSALCLNWVSVVCVLEFILVIRPHFVQASPDE